MRIDVHIERIVVDGALYDGGADALRESVEAGLARALRDTDPSAIAPSGDAIRRVELERPASRDLGAGIADSISRALAPGEAR